jgi:hypothetical protein
MCSEPTEIKPVDWANRYHRFGTVPVDELLPYLQAAFGNSLDVLGQEVNVKSTRLELFCEQPLVCCACGLQATHWAVEVPHSQVGILRPHLNLYGLRPDGTDEQFTQDHIVPKAEGGKDCLDNLQVMCYTCNEIKGGK